MPSLKILDPQDREEKMPWEPDHPINISDSQKYSTNLSEKVTRSNLQNAERTKCPEIDTEPVRYVSLFWVALFFSANLGILLLRIIITSHDYLVELPFGGLLTIHFLALTLSPFSLLTLLMVFSCRPLQDKLYVRFLFLASTLFIYGLRVFEPEDLTSMSRNVLLVSVFLFDFILIMGAKLMYRNAGRLAKSVFNNNNAALENFNLSFVPLVGLSTLLSMLYVASETLGCLFEDDNFGVNVNNCVDVVDSNTSLLYFMVISAFTKVYILPHLPNTYTIDEVVRFAFNSREMVQVIIYGFSSVFTLFIFATGTEISKFVDISGIVNENNTLEDVIDKIEVDESYYEVVDSNSTVKFRMIHNGASLARQEFVFWSLALFAMVPITQLLRRGFLSSICSSFSTELRNRIAPFYTHLLSLLSFLIIVATSCYAYLAWATASGDQALMLVERWRIITSDVLPLLMWAISLHFIGNPKSNKNEEVRMYLSLLVFFALQATGNYSQYTTKGYTDIAHFGEPFRGDRYASAVANGACLVLFAGPMFYMLDRARGMLASSEINKIDRHLQSCLLLGFTVLPPILFLIAESSGCVMYSEELRVCFLLQKSNTATATHFMSGYLFFLMFAFHETVSVSLTGLLTLEDLHFHNLVQMILLMFSTLACFFFYGFRHSENYVDQMYLGEEPNSFDSFLASSWPLAIVSISWIFIFAIQIQYSVRVETESKFHHRSLDSPFHLNCYNRVMGALDQYVKSVLTRIEVKDDEARIGSPYRVFLFVMSSLSFCADATVIWGQTTLSREWKYILSYSANSLNTLSTTAAACYVFTDLTRIHLGDYLVVLFCSFYYPADSYKRLLRDKDQNLSLVFILFYLTVAIVMIRLKRKLVSKKWNGHTQTVLQERAQRIFLSGMGSILPIVFLISEHVGCLVRFSYEFADDDDASLFPYDKECKSIYYGIQSVSSQLLFCYLLFGIFLLFYGNEVTFTQITTLDLSNLALFRYFLLGFSFMFGIFMFGIRREGNEHVSDVTKYLRRTLYYFISVAWFIVAIVEVFIRRSEGNIIANGIKTPPNPRVSTEREGVGVTSPSNVPRISLIEAKKNALSDSARAMFRVKKTPLRKKTPRGENQFRGSSEMDTRSTRGSTSTCRDRRSEGNLELSPTQSGGADFTLSINPGLI